MTKFELSSSEFLIAMPFMSGEDALATQDGTAPFGGADLTGARLRGADLTGANLEGAILEGATFTDAFFMGANLEDARLADANLEDANLAYTNLAGANFEDARLVGTTLRGAKFYGVNLCNANLRGANLSGAKGIAAIYLPGMSTRTEDAFLYAVSGATVMFKAGCFWGTEAELRAKVLQEKGDSKSAKLYLAAIDLAIMALEADGAK